MDVALERLLEHPRIRQAFERAQGVTDDFLSQFGSLIDKLARHPQTTNAHYIRMERQLRTAYQRAKKAELRARQISAKQRSEDPRTILGFGPTEPLTVEKIRVRKRKLAGIFHPDRDDGDAEAMARVNRAAEALLIKV